VEVEEFGGKRKCKYRKDKDKVWRGMLERKD